MRIRAFVGGLSILLVASTAMARTDVFVHGRNQGPADVNDYWHIGYGANNDGVLAFTGNNAESNYTYAYDATQYWWDTSATGPICSLTQAMYNAPGTDMAIITHSAGGNVMGYMLSIAQNGWATSCSVSPASAKAWATYFISIATPWHGSELANAVYGKTGGNFLQTACGTVTGGLANLLFNQATNMTYSLQTSICNQYYSSSLVAWGAYSATYQQWGTSNAGDDSASMGAAAWCAGMPSPNDGVVSASSASTLVPGGHSGWSDAVGHSSNRRNDYRTFAANVWNNNPY